MQAKTRRVAIIGGNRIPFARSNTVYSDASNQEMFTAAVDGLVGRFGLEGKQLGLVTGGAVIKHSRDFNLVREVVLGSALSARTPALDMQIACGTGLQAVITVANLIALGQIAFDQPARQRRRACVSGAKSADYGAPPADPYRRLHLQHLAADRRRLHPACRGVSCHRFSLLQVSLLPCQPGQRGGGNGE